MWASVIHGLRDALTKLEKKQGGFLTKLDPLSLFRTLPGNVAVLRVALKLSALEHLPNTLYFYLVHFLSFPLFLLFQYQFSVCQANLDPRFLCRRLDCYLKAIDKTEFVCTERTQQPLWSGTGGPTRGHCVDSCRGRGFHCTSVECVLISRAVLGFRSRKWPQSQTMAESMQERVLVNDVGRENAGSECSASIVPASDKHKAHKESMALKLMPMAM